MEAKTGASSTNGCPKRVLVAPLDWGLGHATRCIPIIHALLQQGFEVWLAGEGAIRALLQQEFPQLPFLPLRGYRIQYGRSAAGTFFKLLLQLPALLRSIRREHHWLKKAMYKHAFDAIISDNRYGLYHAGTYNIFITHQLQIKAPLSFLENWLRTVHYRRISKYHACWVPDSACHASLGGQLSHPKKMPPVFTRHIGPLSRMKKKGQAKENGLLLLVSGPEPQRTLFEQKLLQQSAILKMPITLVRGLPGTKSLPQVPPHVTVHNHLTATALQKVMQNAAFVICRSGYSTLMDLAALNKKSILIPTPGQTEQAYLARHLQQLGLAPWHRQAYFNLKEALENAAQFPYRPFAPLPDLLTPAVEDLSNRLEKAPQKP